MAKITRIFLHLAVMLFLIEGCLAAWQRNEIRRSRLEKLRARISRRMLNTLAKSSGEFAVKLYRQLSPSRDNFVLSPLGIYTSFAMTYLGSKHRTAGEIKSRIGIKDRRGRAHHAFLALLKSLNESSRNVTMEMAHAVYVRKEYKLKPSFIRRLKRFYHAPVYKFSLKVDNPNRPMNEWIRDKTHNMLPKFLEPGSSDSLTALWLLNSLYFRGTWEQQFNDSQTLHLPFHVTPEDLADVNMLYLDRNLSVGESPELKCRILELPYAGGRYSMFIFLPNAIDGLDDLENKLTYKSLELAIARAATAPGRVEVSIPKIKLSVYMTLREVMLQMGVRRMFQQSKADLSGMDGTKQLYVSEAMYRSGFAMADHRFAPYWKAANETETKPQTSEFRIDHPFMFLIRDKKSNFNIFMGKYSDPLSAV